MGPGPQSQEISAQLPANSEKATRARAGIPTSSAFASRKLKYSGQIRSARRTQKAGTSMRPKASASRTSSEVMRYDERTKNMSTPRPPAYAQDDGAT